MADLLRLLLTAPEEPTSPPAAAVKAVSLFNAMLPLNVETVAAAREIGYQLYAIRNARN